MIWLACAGAFVAGLLIGGAWSLRTMKRPPKHVHTWGKWSRLTVNTTYHSDGVITNKLPTTKQHRYCSTCGYEQVDAID